jgi:rhodanese-related sulfurtransferase
VYYSPIPEIDVNQLAALLASNASNTSLQLIDVRERSEVDIAYIPGFALYPLSEFEQWSERILSDLKPEAETIVVCHHGMRSAQLCQWLSMRGFSEVKNVMGGIDAYSQMVDSSIRRY